MTYLIGENGSGKSTLLEALASIYLGGFRLRQLPRSAARELTPGSLARADLMFSTSLAPWNAARF